MLGRRVRKYRSFRMYLSLHDYQSKASRYRNGLIYLKNKVTKNQKHTTETKKNTSILQTSKPQKKKKKKGTKKKYKIN